MALRDGDRRRIEGALDREPTPAESALFENLWSEHCAYRSSRALLSAFESEGDRVVVGPGDDAAVLAVPAPDDLPGIEDVGHGESDGGHENIYLAVGIESHNHPSYVDPYDGAATGVGGIVRDIVSMGAYPVALLDSLYFGPLDRERSRYLLDGVVEGIADYGNAIGVPTVGGSVEFHESYEGNPLVNVGCVGLLSADRLVTAEAQSPGNRLVVVGNATGRDGLGGAAFASEDLDEDAETEDRPAVQVGDPYTEKLLIETSEALLDRDLVVAARDLGAAGLGGATCELVAKGDLGADLDLDALHRREPGMTATEILLAESQERMCYEVKPEDVAAVKSVAERFDLGCSVVGEVTADGQYVARFEGDVVVNTPAELLAEGAPLDDHDRVEPAAPTVDRPDADLETAFESVVASPSAASKRWIYRQYDHEVGLRTAVGPGDDAAVLAVRETGGGVESGTGIALSAGAAPQWTTVAPRAGARAVALENAANLACVGARPLAAVDCLNGGNPEDPTTYGGFAAVVEGLAEACAALDVPVVGGNVSLYNDSASGPVAPTPTLLMLGARSGWRTPGIDAVPGTTVLLVGRSAPRLGGSEYLARTGGTDRFPAPPEDASARVEAIASVATQPTTEFLHDVSQGGLATTLAETVTAGTAGVDASLPGEDPAAELFGEAPGRAVVGTTDPDAVRRAVGDDAPVTELGSTTEDATLSVRAGETTVRYDRTALTDLRDTIPDAMGE